MLLSTAAVSSYVPTNNAWGFPVLHSPWHLSSLMVALLMGPWLVINLHWSLSFLCGQWQLSWALHGGKACYVLLWTWSWPPFTKEAWAALGEWASSHNPKSPSKAWLVACYDPLVKSTAGPGIPRAVTKVSSERDPHRIGLGCSLVAWVPV